MNTILVTGGTGTLGRQVVILLHEAGCSVRVLSRKSREAVEGVEYVSCDLATGEGVEAAVKGIDVIVHCAGSSKGDEVKTANLVRVAQGMQVRYLVYISVVGAERTPVKSGADRAIFGYFASKLASEQIVINSGLPWTILRATQFHEFVYTIAQATVKMPIMPVFAGIRFQPVNSAEVAARLVELTLGEPAGLAPEMGGPRTYRMSDLTRSYLSALGKRRLILPLPLPGQAARAQRAGANLTPEHAVGQRTWEEFLAARAGAQ